LPNTISDKSLVSAQPCCFLVWCQIFAGNGGDSAACFRFGGPRHSPSMAQASATRIHPGRPATAFASSTIATALSQCHQPKMHHD